MHFVTKKNYPHNVSVVIHVFDELYFLISTESPSDGDDTKDITWLTQINHRARVDSHFTISLSKTDYKESCTLQAPKGNVKNLNDLVMEGVRVVNSTIFVTCGVDIGPISDVSLLGNWILCGQYTEGDVVHKRCQLATIVYS